MSEAGVAGIPRRGWTIEDLADDDQVFEPCRRSQQLQKSIRPGAPGGKWFVVHLARQRRREVSHLLAEDIPDVSSDVGTDLLRLDVP